MSCEGDLTSSDLDAATNALSAQTLGRTAGGSSTSVNLFPYISQDHSYGSNITGTSSSISGRRSDNVPSLVLRAHDTRHQTDLDYSLSSIDEDSGLLITVTFSELVRVKQVLLTSATGDERIESCKVWCNRVEPPTLDEAEEEGGLKPDQEFILLEGERDCVEYPVRVARFASVSNLTVFLSSSRPTTQRLFYLGFKGESRGYKKSGGDNIAVGAQNTADSVVQGIKEKYGSAQTTIR